MGSTEIEATIIEMESTDQNVAGGSNGNWKFHALSFLYFHTFFCSFDSKLGLVCC